MVVLIYEKRSRNKHGPGCRDARKVLHDLYDLGSERDQSLPQGAEYSALNAFGNAFEQVRIRRSYRLEVINAGRRS